MKKKWHTYFLVAGIILVAFNLRPAITSIGPIIDIIQQDIKLSSSAAGLLTSLPLIAFAIMSPIAPSIGNRYSYERAFVFGLALLLIGIMIRSISAVPLLLGGTLLIGLGIAVLNVLLPGLIKDRFPTKVGLMTSIYSTAMGITAAAASGLSITLAVEYELGWQRSLLFPAVPAIVGIFLWLYLSKVRTVRQQTETVFMPGKKKGAQVWGSLLAWQVSAFLGFQSFLFYVTISWLPAILIDYGTTALSAGWMLSFAQFVGLPASFFVPVIAERFYNQRWIAAFLSALVLAGYAGLLVGQGQPVMILCVLLIGFGLNGSFALALTYLGMRARTAEHASALSGMSQTLGYILAAVGPIFIGFLYDATQSWTLPVVTIMGITVLVMFFGTVSGRDRFV